MEPQRLIPLLAKAEEDEVLHLYTNHEQHQILRTATLDSGTDL
jgi:hypothetical protein